MVFRVEPYPARPDLADYFRQQQPDAQPFHGPFWTPLTIAWVVQSVSQSVNSLLLPHATARPWHHAAASLSPHRLCGAGGAT